MAGRDGITIKVVGATEINRSLTKGETMLKDSRPLLRNSAELYFWDVREVFKTEGTSGKQPWEKLSDSRIRARKAQRPSRAQHPILQWDGDLFKAATTTTGHIGNRVWRISKYDPDRAIFEMSGPKVDNQTEDRYKKREFWPWDQKRVDLLYEPFQKWFAAWADNTTWRLPGRRSR